MAEEKREKFEARQYPGDDEYRKQKKERNKALRKSFEQDHPQVRASGGGADIDAEIAALTERVSALETKTDDLDERVTALEEGGEPSPPDPEPPEPPSDKRWPDKGDPMCGCPAGTSLTNAGATTISQNGAKVSGKKFTGRLTITGEDVEVFNCVIECNDWWGVDASKSKRCKFHHVTFTSTSTSGNSGINTGQGMTIEYCKSRGWENALNIAGSDAVIRWNDFDDLKGNSDSHYDTSQLDGGVRNVEICNNRWNCNYGQTSACMVDNYFGAIDNINIHDNWFGGGGYTVYLDASFKGSANATNVKYINNTLKRGYYGYIYWKQPGSGCVKQGNVDASTGEPVN